ncbi:hypothetical protein GCK72_023298 [Caenorhabditis remanei]|uniref:Uncharacterized protein n=1 Tax=Caenorhabditis remanei TaxID=31234 RepID=A0A6A5FVZ0_CAERE|nr:hypothetical protein GCK72_023298 [Caenorhabditis remanei]KAF1746840.1 hypothetical protein GCK72_023298 [Caenorhabditis remanei]
MESNEMPSNPPPNDMPVTKLLILTEKIENFGNAVLISVCLMCAITYISNHIEAYLRRFNQIKQEIAEFTREYREEKEQKMREAEREEKIMRMLVDDMTDVSSDEAIAEDHQSVGDWDFGSSDDTDEYATDIEHDSESEVAAYCAQFEKAMRDINSHYVPIERLRAKARIENAIEFDEYLLDEGLIDNSEFGKTLMVEI